VALGSDEIEWRAALLSHVTRNERHWALVSLAATEGSFTHARAKAALGLSSGGLKGPLDALTDAFVLDAGGAGYRLTSWGEFAYKLLERGTSRAVSELDGASLVLASRPAEIDPQALLGLLNGAASNLIGTNGRYRYIAVCDGDADMVEELLFAVHQLGAEAVGLTVTKVV
jgi:hypothetical protein